jgi:sialate O-acetylesterase
MGGASLYGALLRRVRKAGGVCGILWYQGESDTNPVDAQEYPRLFRSLIGSLRADLGAPALPFLFVQLGRLVSESSLADLRAWNVVQDAQRHVNLDLSGTAMTTAVDLDLEDAIHISTRAQKRLGRRLAILARATAYGDTSVKTGPKPGRITVDDRSRDQITIEFEDVNKSLRPAGRLTGFSLRNMDGYHIPILFREEVDPRRPTMVRLYATRSIPRCAALHYGWGRDPYCNLVDELDMAAPAFGPIYL